jgi:hypothetical protein
MAENEAGQAIDQEPGATQPSDQGTAEADQFFQFIRRRSHELQAAGMPEGRARATAMLEDRIAGWPPEWGSELRVILYGDFEAPAGELAFPDLGIVVEPDPVKRSIVSSALCVLKARVTVSERSIAGLADAGARIDRLLGILTALDWGNSGNGWWCSVTHEGMAGVCLEFNKDAIDGANQSVQALPPDVRRKITSALYWIREPRQMMREGYRSDVLRVYAGYWNAFECLVEAVCIVRPQSKMTKQQKLDAIAQFIADRGGKPDVAALGECYRSFVDPGFVAKASHALRVCFPQHADRYIHECFRVKPKRDRLYDIRNAINHGDIEAGDLQELIRVEDKHRRLWFIVFGMLGQFISIPRPLDTDLN